jgi:hypothetical protein
LDEGTLELAVCSRIDQGRQRIRARSRRLISARPEVGVEQGEEMKSNPAVMCSVPFRCRDSSPPLSHPAFPERFINWTLNSASWQS